MKKLLSVAVIAAAFALVGCASKKADTNSIDTEVKKEACKDKSCKKAGKLGVEKTTEDTAK